ncbi:hypothetical protein EXIGLDRAFT_780976 [Exidia glandulosa HHB12029]|uniref:Uncharacterized protein n=1 Tax=Exidia glandulosa HHB12029 TaxID=1314781 RepID=A0A165BE06_EXIGL|nr:hypothetical protein EXIGLDRAFT_780976 [Exidia glandulosa HHB12029]
MRERGARTEEPFAHDSRKAARFVHDSRIVRASFVARLLSTTTDHIEAVDAHGRMRRGGLSDYHSISPTQAILGHLPDHAFAHLTTLRLPESQWLENAMPNAPLLRDVTISLNLGIPPALRTGIFFLKLGEDAIQWEVPSLRSLTLVPPPAWALRTRALVSAHNIALFI